MAPEKLMRAGGGCVISILAALALLAGPVGGIVAAASAQDDPASSKGDTLRLRQLELDAVRAEQKAATESEQKLRQEIEVIGADRRTLGQALIDSAARLRSIETRMALAEQRLHGLDARGASLRASLDARRGTIIDVLVALQRMGRRPPPAILIGAPDALESVRAAIVLGATLPDLSGEAKAIARDLSELTTLRRDIDGERRRLAQDRDLVTTERHRISLLTEERQRRQDDVVRALEAERHRAASLAHQVDNLKDLIARMETEIESASRAARQAARASQAAAAVGAPSGGTGALKDPGRLAPTVEFAAAKGKLPLPVNGVRIREFGASDGVGGSEKGLVVATHGGAQVTAPADGWVVYAGAFRSYGQLLIINAGGGYHMVLAGMQRISVDIGQFVLTGEPIAVMGDGPRTASAIGIGVGQPVLYIEFRKDGSPIDPAPWWAGNDNQKVRG